jgi:hypothetical protein
LFSIDSRLPQPKPLCVLGFIKSVDSGAK